MEEYLHTFTCCCVYRFAHKKKSNLFRDKKDEDDEENILHMKVFCKSFVRWWSAHIIAIADVFGVFVSITIMFITIELR